MKKSILFVVCLLSVNLVCADISFDETVSKISGLINCPLNNLNVQQSRDDTSLFFAQCGSRRYYCEYKEIIHEKEYEEMGLFEEYITAGNLSCKPEN